MAGKLTVNEIILGDSSTPSQNFLLKTNQNGTATLARNADGSGGDILTVASDGKVTLNKGETITQSKLQSGTSVASTSGTSIDFTGIPSWAKRITVMFYGVSTNGSSIAQIQIGSTTFTTSGYSSHSTSIESTTAGTTAGGNGFILDAGGSASFVRFGQIVITLVGSNQYVYSSVLGVSGATGARTHYSGGASQALSGTLDRIRITTVNGTDTFDAGSINVMWE